eukprot:TRINITY_DN8483_c0_g4_i1.p1 TRINITY_DN8483_c0_g4~~TRINITY_DN8483_c0_g4_i1.p1  ORF type:complete len:819 (-),score=154.43 TRINITY_DN8483_c0_g4_i1:45-2465(-)
MESSMLKPLEPVIAQDEEQCIGDGAVDDLLQREVQGLIHELSTATAQIVGASRVRLQRLFVQREHGIDGDCSFRENDVVRKSDVCTTPSADPVEILDLQPSQDSCSLVWLEAPRRIFRKETRHCAVPSEISDIREDDAIVLAGPPPVQQQTCKELVSSPSHMQQVCDSLGHDEVRDVKSKREVSIGRMRGALHGAIAPKEFLCDDNMPQFRGVRDCSKAKVLLQKRPVRKSVTGDDIAHVSIADDDVFKPSTQRPYSAPSQPRSALRKASEAQMQFSRPVSPPPLPPLPLSLPGHVSFEACDNDSDQNPPLTPLPLPLPGHVSFEACDNDSDQDPPLTPPPLGEDGPGRESIASFGRRRSAHFRGDGPPHGIFMDSEKVKAAVRNAVNQEEYDVKSFYTTEGIWQKIARHPLFDGLTLVIIGANAIWMAIDADFNKDENGAPIVTLHESHPVFQVAEHFACIYFSGELLIRWLAFRRTYDAVRDAWFLMDSALVMMMVLETWIMALILQFIVESDSDGKTKNMTILRMLRIVRMLRMARLAKLVRALPELMILVKGMLMAARSVLLTMVLLCLIIYVFGIAMTRIVDESASRDEWWHSVPQSMKSLLLHGCFLEDLPRVVNVTASSTSLGAFCIIIFVLLASMTVMNMLVGVLCEVVQCVASIEKEMLQVNFVKNQIQTVCDEMGNSDSIGRVEFDRLLSTPSAAVALAEVGVDVVGLVDFGDFIFGTQESICFNEFMETVLQLRGSNMATVKDVVDMRKSFMSEILRVEQSVLLAFGESGHIGTPSREWLSEKRRQHQALFSGVA